MMAAPRQIPLALDHRPALGRAAFLVSGSNAAAVAALDGWRGWPGRRLALIGPARSGKTHLAHVWMRESGAEWIAAADLNDAAAQRLARHGCAVVEDADALAGLEPGRRRVAETALFHLWNLAAAEGAWLLVTGREAPGRWRVETPDLRSRLAALPVARLAPPDDTLLSSVLVKLFADRQIHVGPGVVAYLARRIERSFAAAEAAVAALDRLSLERKKPVTRVLAAEFLGPGAASDATE
jgi:chromosomal replication initiation ATPase DnaA